METAELEVAHLKNTVKLQEEVLGAMPKHLADLADIADQLLVI